MHPTRNNSLPFPDPSSFYGAYFEEWIAYHSLNGWAIRLALK
jgi:hypothetical protein